MISLIIPSILLISLSLKGLKLTSHGRESALIVRNGAKVVCVRSVGDIALNMSLLESKRE